MYVVQNLLKHVAVSHIIIIIVKIIIMIIIIVIHLCCYYCSLYQFNLLYFYLTLTLLDNTLDTLLMQSKELKLLIENCL